MIRVFGHEYDLPSVLMPCPQCRRGHLTWDGLKWACTSEGKVRPGTADPYVDGRCRRGFSLGGLFAEPNAEGRFQLGRVRIDRLPLTAEAIALLEGGVVRFAWATPAFLWRARERVEQVEDRLRFHVYRQSMEQKPNYRRGGL